MPSFYSAIKAKNPKLTIADYDFSDVKSGVELQACEFYEYARESRAVRMEVESIRKQNLQIVKGTPIKFGPRVQNMLQGYHLMIVASISDFPNTPWPKLTDKDNQNLCKYIASASHVSRYINTFNNPPISFSINAQGTSTLNEWEKQCREILPDISKCDPIKFGFFAVNMKYGHTVLIEEFTKYLRLFEGKSMLEPPPFEKKTTKAKRIGRKSIHDTLNALGVMRLRYHCESFSEAQKKMQILKLKPHGMFYGRRDSANRACDAATSRFQKLFGWLDPEKPIHFTTGWGTHK